MISNTKLSEQQAAVPTVDLQLESKLVDTKDDRIKQRRSRIEQKRQQVQKQKHELPLTLAQQRQRKQSVVSLSTTAAIADQTIQPAQQPAVEKVKEIKKDLAKLQVLESQTKLLHLQSEQEESLSSVMVGVQKREFEFQKRKLEESKKGVEILTEEKLVEENWAKKDVIKNAYELHAMFEKQKEGIRVLVQHKEKLLAAIKQKVKENDEQFVTEIKIQAQEIEQLLQIMKHNHEVLKSSFKQELDQIEMVYMQERQLMLQQFLQDFDKWSQQRQQTEQKYLESHPEQQEQHALVLEQLRTKDAEDYNLTKIKLETDLQVLEQQWQKMKAVYQLNTEKLEYNFQVLKRRDEENSITVTSQKRKMNRLNDVLNALKIKTVKQEEIFKKEFHQLSEDYERILGQFKEFELKFFRFQSQDTTLYREISEMNQAEVFELLNTLLKADRVLWELLLQTDWEMPNDFEKLQDSGEKKGFQTFQKKHLTKEDLLELKEANVLSFEFIKTLAEEMGPLILNEKLNDPIETMQQVLIAIGITSIKEIDQLKQFYEEKETTTEDKNIINLVLKFVKEKRKEPQQLSEITQQQQLHLKTGDLSTWRALQKLNHSKNFNVWNALYDVSLQYHHLIKDRHFLQQEVEQLERENEEMQSLLKGQVADGHLNDFVISPLSGLEEPIIEKLNL